MLLNFKHKLLARKAKTNSAGEAVWSGSSQFAIWIDILWIQTLIIKILFKNRKKKLFEIFDHLLLLFTYFDL